MSDGVIIHCLLALSVQHASLTETGQINEDSQKNHPKTNQEKIRFLQ